MDRRVFIKGTAVASAAAIVASQGFLKGALATPAVPGPGPYGALLPTADANGLFLPAGFTSRVVGVSGQAVTGTAYTWHGSPDGGATFAHPDGSWTYACNSEQTPGGVGSITFAPNGDITGARRILDGTRNNCAGGPSTWGTWMSCEEVSTGWIYDCEPLGTPATAVRLDALGQRAHEACAVDPIGKWIYTTEDTGTSRFYRFSPNEWVGDKPNFAAGGVLQALNANLAAAVTGPTPVNWVTVSDLTRGYTGADSSSFARGEGCWIHGQTVYFCTTSDSRVWAVNGVNQTIEVVYIGGTGSLQDADNITVHKQSTDIYVAEDAGNMELVIIGDNVSGVREIAPFLRFDTPLGNGSEVTGPAFSPDGKRLYVSSQRGRVGSPGGNGSGVTYEITGPFRGISTDPEPVVPEVSMPLLLGATGVATVGALAFLNRRRGESEGPAAIA
jgi:secreted PhoX family phosphatase